METSGSTTGSQIEEAVYECRANVRCTTKGVPLHATNVGAFKIKVPSALRASMSDMCQEGQEMSCSEYLTNQQSNGLFKIQLKEDLSVFKASYLYRLMHWGLDVILLYGELAELRERGGRGCFDPSTRSRVHAKGKAKNMGIQTALDNLAIEQQKELTDEEIAAIPDIPNECFICCNEFNYAKSLPHFFLFCCRQWICQSCVRNVA